MATVVAQDDIQELWHKFKEDMENQDLPTAWLSNTCPW